MPTTTFYNLPEGKREKILSAIKDEFSRVPFDEVSINKIIQAAGIPRGSFYQYFADKYDMLQYLLTDYQQQVMEHMKMTLQTTEGNIFSMFMGIIDFAIGFVMDEKTNSFCKNLFSDIRLNAGFYTMRSKDEMQEELMKEIRPYINVQYLDIRNEKDLFHMLEILSSIAKDAIVDAFLNMTQYEEVKANYLAKIEILKRGFLKNKEETN